MSDPQLAPSDLQLLDRWRMGDDGAGDALLGRHFDSLCRFFRNKVEAGVDDLVQTTMLRCVEKRDQFRRHSSFRTYLFVIARNLLYDRLRSQHRAPQQLDFSAVSLRDLGTSPSKGVARNERKRALMVALQTLPLEFQIVVELTYWEGLNATEVGEVLGIPGNTVRSRLSRARKSLDAHLQDL
ncbi:MAG: RNA polymerase sigma factor [Nannocystales bacterium]